MEAFASIFQKLYADFDGIFTIICVVIGAIALASLLFGHSDKSASAAWSWIKRIAIAWVLFNSLGAILTYGEALLQGNKYSGTGGTSSTVSDAAASVIMGIKMLF